MDIQKEREAFNKEFGADHSDSKLPFGDGMESSAALKCNWLGWQKRAELEYRNNPEIVERIFEDLNKTQVPEGLVLVEKCDIEVMLQLIDNSLSYKSAPNKDDTMKIVKKMLKRISEAQDQSNDPI